MAPRVGLLFGGRSSEHGISCLSAASVLAVINRSKYDVVAIGISREGRWVMADDDPAHYAISAGGLPSATPASLHGRPMVGDCEI